MLRVIIYSIIILLINASMQGQTSFEPDNDPFFAAIDTVHIDDVDVISSVSKKYQVGSKTQNFTPMQKQSVEQGNLADLISRYAPVYIKSDAGGLSSFQFRGTNSNHTSVLVGGLNINSLTLGSANASSIPIFLFDEVDLMFGSSSATNGSGSIGGSVRMGLSNNWTDGVKGEAMLSTGSFGEYTGGAKIYAGNGKFESVTRLLYFKKENNFDFLNTVDYDFETQSYSRDTQRYASIENKYLLQEFNYKFNKAESIKSFVWLSNNMHQAQPNMGQNISESLSPREIEDQNIRTWVQYDNNGPNKNYFIGAGYVSDSSIDQGDNSQSIATQRLISEIGLNQKFNFLKYTVGAKYKFIAPNVYAYDEDITEQHLDLYASLIAEPIKGMKATLNLRQQFVSNFEAPFTPALGLDYILLTTDHEILKVSGNIQKFYRIPTFNDRYWGQEGYEGNEGIDPENGMNYEVGLAYTRCSDNFTLRANANYYYMDVENWILWVQRSQGWRAENILKVISQGIEFHIDATLKTEDITWTVGGNYSYNSAIRKESSNSTDAINRQLEYVPKNLANAFLNIQRRKSGINIDYAFTDERYYDQTTKYLEAYALLNLGIYHNLKLGSHKIRVDFHVNNLMNVDYQNQYRYAMPGRSYRIGIKYIINN